MGKFAGLLMIAAGVGTAAYVYPLVTSNADRAEKQLADVVAITTAAIPASQADPKATRPPVPVVVKPASGADGQRVVSAETSPGKLPLAAAPKTPAVAALTASPDTQPVARPIEIPQPLAAKRPGRNDDEARLTLTREIQRELKRVGCFEGAADGSWTADTRQAMKTFIDRVNATLPIDEPDHILKTLVQGHPGNACGKSCPAGQGLSGDGKCLPTAIIAQSGKRPAQRAATQAWETRTTVAEVPRPAPAAPAATEVRPEVRPEPPAGRMSIGAANVPPPSPSSVTAGENEPKAKRAGIVLKPREATPDAKPEAKIAALPPTDKSAAIPDTSRPPIGAVAAVEPPAAKATPRPAAVPAAVEVDDAAASRSAPRARLAPAPTIVYRPPPQRYVTSYTPPSYVTQGYRERQRFGPQIFKELERNSR